MTTADRAVSYSRHALAVTSSNQPAAAAFHVAVSLAYCSTYIANRPADNEPRSTPWCQTLPSPRHCAPSRRN